MCIHFAFFVHSFCGHVTPIPQSGLGWIAPLKCATVLDLLERYHQSQGRSKSPASVGPAPCSASASDPPCSVVCNGSDALCFDCATNISSSHGNALPELASAPALTGLFNQSDHPHATQPVPPPQQALERAPTPCAKTVALYCHAHKPSHHDSLTSTHRSEPPPTPTLCPVSYDAPAHPTNVWAKPVPWWCPACVAARADDFEREARDGRWRPVIGHDFRELVKVEEPTASQPSRGGSRRRHHRSAKRARPSEASRRAGEDGLLVVGDIDEDDNLSARQLGASDDADCTSQDTPDGGDGEEEVGGRVLSHYRGRSFSMP